jgi:DNA-directed RNA polymerase specialized sigma24 family protein
MGMDYEDIECEMRSMLLVATRKFAAEHGRFPPPAFVIVVIKRRVSHFSRASRKWWRKVDQLIEEFREQPKPDEHLAVDDGATPEEALAEADLEEVYQALVYVIQRDLPPAAFAILHLRVIEELSPVEIAELAGIESNSLASKRIGYAKRRAWAMLKALGIERWEDVAHAPPEVSE